jgi:hypothetical protein
MVTLGALEAMPVDADGIVFSQMPFVRILPLIVLRVEQEWVICAPLTDFFCHA